MRKERALSAIYGNLEDRQTYIKGRWNRRMMERHGSKRKMESNGFQVMLTYVTMNSLCKLQLFYVVVRPCYNS